MTDNDHDKNILTKLTSENFAARLPQANLASKIIANLVFDDNLKHLNKKVTSNKTKHVLVENELNELSKKVKLLSSKDYSFLLGRIYFTSDDRFQNVFVDEPTFTMIKYKNTSAEYVISWKSKAVYNSKPITLNSSFLLNIKYFFIKGLQFNNTSLVIEQKNYTRKILNVYFVYDLDLLHWICDNQRFKIRKN